MTRGCARGRGDDRDGQGGIRGGRWHGGAGTGAGRRLAGRPRLAGALAGRILWAGLYGWLGFGLGEAAEATAADLAKVAAAMAALPAGAAALALARPLRR